METTNMVLMNLKHIQLAHVFPCTTVQQFCTNYIATCKNLLQRQAGITTCVQTVTRLLQLHIYSQSQQLFIFLDYIHSYMDCSYCRCNIQQLQASYSYMAYIYFYSYTIVIRIITIIQYRTIITVAILICIVKILQNLSQNIATPTISLCFLHVLTIQLCMAKIHL